MIEHLYHPGRLNFPLKRTGGRGSNEWQALTWDDALGEVAERLAVLRNRYGPETLAFTHGTYRTYHWDERRFFNLFGSPNLCGANTVCHCPSVAVEYATYGGFVRGDIAATKCLVLWGSAPSQSNPLFGFPEIVETKKRGAQLIVVDPRRTREASLADIWLPIRPGTDVALMLSVYLPGQPPPEWRYAMNLDTLPLPDPELLIPSVADSAEFWVPVQSRRGCPMDCSFCSTSAIEGCSIRRHSPTVIAGWLARVARRGFRNFHFVDNTFNLPPNYAKELCRRMIELDLDLNLWCIIYPKWIDREQAQLMAWAGCREVSLGFESGSDRILGRFNKRFKSEEVGIVSKIFAEAGIQRRGFLLLGGPGETRESVEESLDFADSLNLDALKITVGLRIYPGTPLAATALSEELIAPGEDLLRPRFYLAPGLAAWLPERVAAYTKSRSWVM
jgi:hypothetical protein